MTDRSASCTETPLNFLTFLIAPSSATAPVKFIGLSSEEEELAKFWARV